MEQNQKLTFRSENSQNVASPPDQDFPDTVLLFEPRISYPALRVTKSKKLFKINRFFCKLALKIDKISKKIDFSFFSLFSKNFAIGYPQFQPTNNL